MFNLMMSDINDVSDIGDVWNYYKPAGNESVEMLLYTSKLRAFGLQHGQDQRMPIEIMHVK